MDERSLNDYYFNLAHPSAYTSVDKLKRASRLPKRQIQTWLEGQPSYTLHKPIRRKFPRNPYTVSNIHDTWEADLVDMQSLAKYNKGYKFLLNVIDTFSKKVWSIPLKNKKGATVTAAFEKVLKTSQTTPLSLQTDKGGEFNNLTFQSMLRKNGIEFHTTKNPDIKGSMVERYNRTQRTKMFKYFNKENTYSYLPILNLLVKNYNDSVHSTTGMAPSQVTPRDVKKIWLRMQKQHGKIRQGKVKFRLGQKVRMVKEKGHFAKGFETNFTNEVFQIVKVIDRHPQPVYELSDMQNQPIDGQFYNFELTAVQLPSDTEFEIEKIVASRKRRGVVEKLVKWKGYEDLHNSWIKEKDIREV